MNLVESHAASQLLYGILIIKILGILIKDKLVVVRVKLPRAKKSENARHVIWVYFCVCRQKEIVK